MKWVKIQQWAECIVCPTQDIVTAHEHFNMDEFVGQFQTALRVTAPRKRAFLLSWMQVGCSACSSSSYILGLRCYRQQQQTAYTCATEELPACHALSRLFAQRYDSGP